MRRVSKYHEICLEPRPTCVVRILHYISLPPFPALFPEKVTDCVTEKRIEHCKHGGM